MTENNYFLFLPVVLLGGGGGQMGKGSNEPRVDVLRPLKLGVHKKTLSF